MVRHRQRHRRYRHSRPPHANAQESHHTHRRTDGYEDSFSTTEDESQFVRDNSEPLMWSSTSRFGDTAAVPHSDDSVPDTRASQGQAMESEWPAPGTSDDREIFSSNHYYSRLSFSFPALGDWAVAYQDSPHDCLQDPISSVTSPLEEEASAYLLESAHGQTGPTSSEYHQPGEIQTTSTPRRWTPGADVPLNRAFQGLSMRACEGSEGQLSGADPYDNADMPISMNQPEGIEENDSGDSNGGTTPVDRNQYRDQYVDRCMGGGDIPWSPEFPHQTPDYQYPY